MTYDNVLQMLFFSSPLPGYKQSTVGHLISFSDDTDAVKVN